MYLALKKGKKGTVQKPSDISWAPFHFSLFFGLPGFPVQGPAFRNAAGPIEALPEVPTEPEVKRPMKRSEGGETNKYNQQFIHVNP